MLRELHIKDFAIIDELHLALEPGFNILTGETGAGKSILIDAVLLILGARADTSAIRLGAERCRVEGMFLLSPALQAVLAPLVEGEGLEGEASDTVWLSRELRRTGRTVARVNGRVVSLSLLREIAELLVDVHGQGEHLSLLRVREHLNLLDRFARLGPLRADLADEVHQVQKIRRELARLISNEQDRMQRIDLLRFQVEEIQQAKLKPDEKASLESELTRLANAEQLVKLASSIANRLEEDQDGTPSVVDLIGQSQKDMAALARIDGSLSAQMALLNDVAYQIEDLAGTLRDYAAEIEFNPKRQAWIEERLVLLRHLERKYGGSLEDVIVHADRAAAELRTLEHSDERIVELREKEGELLADCAVLADDLSRRRREAAVQLAAGVETELNDLRMAGARFGVAFNYAFSEEGLPLKSPRSAAVAVTSLGEELLDGTVVETVGFDATGIEQVEFLVAPNVGEGLKSLVRTASGGETARLMLALKTVLSRADRTPTLIFDEIDQGIGGRIGVVVGQKLWQLTATAENGDVAHQVLCITHLPQLAGFGDVHFKVAKEIVENRTVTHVRRLDGEARIQELAQMLGTQGSVARRGGYEILQQADTIKHQI